MEGNKYVPTTDTFAHNHEYIQQTINDSENAPRKRPLLILIRQADGSLQQAARNENVVYNLDDLDMDVDPYGSLAIKNNYFSVENGAPTGSGSWVRIITFKYSPSDQQWYLHKDGKELYDYGDPTSYYIKTTKDFGKVPFKQFIRYEE